MSRTSTDPWSDDANPALLRPLGAGADLAHKDLAASLEPGAELGVFLPVAEMTSVASKASSPSGAAR